MLQYELFFTLQYELFIALQYELFIAFFSSRGASIRLSRYSFPIFLRVFTPHFIKLMLDGKTSGIKIVAR